MSWSVGYDSNWNRDIGYGVPAWCDHPGCQTEIHRGLSYVCGDEIRGGERGCGLYFCPEHSSMPNQLCTRCSPKKPKKPFCAKPDHPDWIRHKLTDESWSEWRAQHADEVAKMEEAIK